MKVALSTIGKFHTFDLARELFKRGRLDSIFTGYPRFKLKQENLPTELIHTFPWIHTPYMGFSQRSRLGIAINREWEYWDRVTFGRHVARKLPDVDIFMGLSSTGLEAGEIAKKRGIKFICDRGSAHIRTQNQILKEEHDRWDLNYKEIDPRIIEREESEYEIADCITVPSKFAQRTFTELSLKTELIPYGVNLDKFYPVAKPRTKSFDVLYVGNISLQKGIPYLLLAFEKLQTSNKTLTLVGSYTQPALNFMRSLTSNNNISFKGSVEQSHLKELMSRAHVMVLPSVQEGFGMVQAQAMACGCPVIASTHTGAEDLYTDGKEGFIVPPRDVDALTEGMQKLADNPLLREQMSTAALFKVKRIGGWSQYGDTMTNLMLSLAS